MGDFVMHAGLWRSVRKWLGHTSCPTEQQLAAYADRQLIGEERHTVEHHLADCHVCAEQVAFLTRSASADDSAVPPELLNKAVAFGRPAASRQIPSWAPAAAGATAVILLLLSAIQLPRHRNVTAVLDPSIGPSSISDTKPVINDSGAAVQLRGNEDKQAPFIYPVAGQKVGTDHLVFRWTPSEQAESYEIELLTETGTLLWNSRVSSANAALPSSIRFLAGRTYYIKLSIHQKDGAIQHTRAIGFVAE
jgi:hypothetical protein